MVNKDFHSVSHAFPFGLTIWDVAGDEADFKIKSFVMGSGINDIFHGVMVMHGRGQITEESSRENIIHHSEAMGTEEDPAFHKPCIEQSIPLELPEGKGSTDVDVEADNVAVHIVGTLVHWDTDTINILGEFITRRDVISMVMHPREEVRSIRRMLFWLLTFWRACKKSQMNGLMG